MPVLVPDLLYRDDAFRAGLAVEVDEHTGRITRIGARDAWAGRDVVHLRGRALLPGLVNAHSHAFQRVIRGRTQWRPADASVSDFWTWREAMYAAALQLTPEEVYDVACFCFIEMLRAGITTVGEFHYLHNDEGGRAYDDPAELARRVIAAAADAGLRIRLLNVCYATGAIGAPLLPEQRRFATPQLDAFLAATTRLAAAADGERVSVGVAPHSVRAVPRGWLQELHAFAAAGDMPLHMHVSEQTGEVDACVRQCGVRPAELLHGEGLLDERFTAVHATHLSDAEVHLLAGSGATVCACPGTERDLGDGFMRTLDLLRAGGHIALGSDSQTIIDPLEEARLLEYNERLLRRQRVILGEPVADGRLEVAPVLLRAASAGGARSLRLAAGELRDGLFADIVAIDLGHIALAGASAATLPALLALSGRADAVTDVWVGGRRVVRDGTHAGEAEARARFEAVALRVAGAA